MFMGKIEGDAHDAQDRAYGGVIRAGKGKLVESMVKGMVAIAWKELGKERDRLSFSSQKITIPIQRSYLDRLPDRMKNTVATDICQYVYKCPVDVHIMVDDELVMAIECKAFTENAMPKKILVDFMLLKTQYPDLRCVLVQLESQLGGDYVNLNQDMAIGSKSTRTLKVAFSLRRFKHNHSSSRRA